MRKDPLTVNLRLMVAKFEETGLLNARCGRERKHITTETTE